eukprot:4685122-Amphidinium_carterae.2
MVELLLLNIVTLVLARGQEAITTVEAKLGSNVLPVQVPIRTDEGEFVGVFDVVRMVALTWATCAPDCKVEVFMQSNIRYLGPSLESGLVVILVLEAHGM